MHAWRRRAHGPYLVGMYRNSKRYGAGEDAALYLAVADLALSAQAQRAGVGVGVVRVLVQVAALRAGGAVVVANDLAAAGLCSSAGSRTLLAECKRLGWVSSTRGKLDVLSKGRVVVAELARAWERSRRELGAFGDARPYSARPARLQADME